MRVTKAELIASGLIAALLLTLFAPSFRIERYSCHMCRNLESVEVHSFLFWDIGRRETIGSTHPTETGHSHDWWWYSTYRQSGPWGITSKSASSRKDLFRDGWLPPAGSAPDHAPVR